MKCETCRAVNAQDATVFFKFPVRDYPVNGQPFYLYRYCDKHNRTPEIDSIPVTEDEFSALVAEFTSNGWIVD